MDKRTKSGCLLHTVSTSLSRKNSILAKKIGEGIRKIFTPGISDIWEGRHHNYDSERCCNFNWNDSSVFKIFRLTCLHACNLYDLCRGRSLGCLPGQNSGDYKDMKRFKKCCLESLKLSISQILVVLPLVAVIHSFWNCIYNRSSLMCCKMSLTVDPQLLSIRRQLPILSSKAWNLHSLLSTRGNIWLYKSLREKSLDLFLS